jgi:hypothetical protein
MTRNPGLDPWGRAWCLCSAKERPHAHIPDSFGAIMWLEKGENPKLWARRRSVLNRLRTDIGRQT